MARKEGVTFDNLFPKLYNIELWFLAYQRIAPKPGNMTAGVDGKTIDGMGIRLISETIADLKASRYTPQPTRRVYLPKPNGKQRPLGIPCFRDKLLQTVVGLILEAIYEPTFADTSHGFRPQRSCHTALHEVKRMNGTRWWVEGDIKGFFDDLNHDTLLRILGKRITDKRFLHLIQQFLRAGYAEAHQHHPTYSGTPQGGNLSPLLSNIYLNELDQAIAAKAVAFNQGTKRKKNPEYNVLHVRKYRAKKEARRTGDWTRYKQLRKQHLQMQPDDPQDPNFRRLTYVRYADDFLVGVIGSKADAVALKQWLEEFLQTELHLELSAEKTLISNARQRVRFLGYDIKRWVGKRRIVRYPTKNGVATKRSCTYQLALLMPKEKCYTFARTYGNVTGWKGRCRSNLINLSDLEILMIYNAEVRGFLNYYALADNLKVIAANVLWLTTGSFFCTLAGKHKSSLAKEAGRWKHGTGRYAIEVRKADGNVREYALLSSTKQIERNKIDNYPDKLPNTHKYRNRTELGQRLLANQCEWCQSSEGLMEVHHIRKLGKLTRKTLWERQMIERRRKTMVLCVKCHDDLHAGRLRARQ